MYSSMPGAYVLDKDGTLVNHGVAVDGAADFLARLHAESVPYVILSNTGEKDGARVAAQLTQVLGIPVDASRVYTAMEHMRAELEASRFDVRTVGARVGPWSPLDLSSEPPDDASDVCIAVFSDGAVDDYCATVTAVGAWVSRGAHLWVTSLDSSVAESVHGRVRRRPGPGVFVDAVRAVADVRVRAFGKGGADEALGRATMGLLQAQGFRGSSRQVMMVGDRFDTDVRTGGRNGWRTCLVESGCHTECDAALFPSDVADVIAVSLRDLADLPQDASVGEAIADAVREALRRVTPQSRNLASWLSDRLTRVAQRIDNTLQAPPRRIQSCPDMAGM